MVRDIEAGFSALFYVRPSGDVLGVDDAIAYEITLDTSWTPYGQVTMVLPLDDELAGVIDPINTQTTAELVVFLSRNLPNPDDTTQQDQFTFLVRGVTRDYTAQTMTVRCATAESLADTWAWHSSTPQTFAAGTPVTWVVNSILVNVGGSLDEAASQPTAAVIPEELTWEAGTTATQILQAVVGPTNLKIIADPSNTRWLLIDPNLPVTTGPTEPRRYDMADFIAYETRGDLDAGHYADNVVTIFEWTTDAGAQQRRVYAAEQTVLDPTWHVERIDGRPTGANAPYALRSRLAQWGRERTLRMLWDLELRPGHTMLIDHPDGRLTQGLVQSVAYREDGTMTVTASEELYDTGWVPVEVAQGFAAMAGYEPRVRRVGPVIYFDGGWSKTGLAANSANVTVGTVPAEFTPPRNVLYQAATNGAFLGRIRITTGGQVAVTTAATLADYYLMTESWLRN